MSKGPMEALERARESARAAVVAAEKQQFATLDEARVLADVTIEVKLTLPIGLAAKARRLIINELADPSYSHMHEKRRKEVEDVGRVGGAIRAAIVEEIGEDGLRTVEWAQTEGTKRPAKPETSAPCSCSKEVPF